MKIKFGILALILMATASHSDIALNDGDIYTLDISEISNWVIWSSPDHTPYDDYSYTIRMKNGSYDYESDDLRIRLYEEFADDIPQATIFEPFTAIANLTSSSNHISQYNIGGSLWHDFTGKLEIEVLSGSIELDSIDIILGPGSTTFTGSIDAIPEPNTAALLALAAGVLFKIRKSRTIEQ